MTSTSIKTSLGRKLALRHVRDVSKHAVWAVKQVFRITPRLAISQIGLSILAGLSPAAGVYVSQHLIDSTVSAAGGGPAGFEKVLLWVAAYFAVSVLAEDLFGRINSLISTRKTQLINYRIDEERFSLAVRLPLIAYEDAETYNLFQRSDNPGRKIDQTFSQLTVIARCVVQIISLSFFLAALSPWIPVLFLFMQTPVVFLLNKTNKMWMELHHKQTEAQRAAAYMDNLVIGRNEQKELRIYGLKSLISSRWRSKRAQIRRDNVTMSRKVELLHFPSFAVTVGAQGLVMLYAAYQLDQQLLTAGFFVAAFQAVEKYGFSFFQASIMLRDWLNRSGEVQFVREFLALEEKLPETSLKKEAFERIAHRYAAFPALQEGLHFEQVEFGYPGKDPVIRGMSFTIKPGEHVAIVGENGAGKSTLVKLLTGLYEPSAGKITADGIEYARIHPESLRSQVSAAFQDFYNFELTLAESIALGNPASFRQDGREPDLEAVTQAAQLGGADEVAASLAGGWAQPVGYRLDGGTGLSGGQWQRVALSRALMRDPKVIILDEPTAALDPKAEAELYSRFLNVMNGRTVIVISHRLGSARLADRILVVKDGVVFEEGHHDFLVASGGAYARMWEEQALWYR